MDGMTEVWEPWTPEIGQRVRVLERPECFYCRGDQEAEAGETGTVTAIDVPKYPRGSEEPGELAHRFWVAFDDPTIAERTVHGCATSHFAAAELEPVP